jgi:hypothetical protein
MSGWRPKMRIVVFALPTSFSGIDKNSYGVREKMIETATTDDWAVAGR